MKTGEEFYLIPEDGRLVCKSDYELAKEKRELFFLWTRGENRGLWDTVT